MKTKFVCKKDMMKKKTFLFLMCFLFLLTALGFSSPQPAAASGTTICGSFVTDYYDAGLTSYMYTVLVTCSGERILWSAGGGGGFGWLGDGYWRISSPNIVSTDFDLRGGHVSKEITGYSNAEPINSCQVCNAQPPTPIPPTLIPPTPVPPTRVPPTSIPPTLITPTLKPPTPTQTPLQINPPLIGVYPLGVYPNYKQNIGNWSDLKYADNTEDKYTIAYVGCALTTVANLLSYYGAGEIDPGTLNAWMKDHGGFDSAYGVIWSSVDNYIKQGGNSAVIKWERNIVHNDPNINLQNSINDSLLNNWPVILQITMPQSASGIHYVVAIGLTETSPGKQEYIIRDPLDHAGSITRLEVDDPNNQIQQAIFYRPVDGIIRTLLTIRGHSPIAYVLMDGQGRRLGYDPTSDSHYWEIPDGNYAYNPPIWNPLDQSGSTGMGESLEASISGVSAGDYRLIVYDIGDGPYEIETFYNDEKNQSSKAMINGTAHTGNIHSYDIQVGQGDVRIAINTQASMSSSSAGGFGLGILFIVLAVGGVFIFVSSNRARKKIHRSSGAQLIGMDGLRANITSTDFVIGRASNCSLRLTDSSVSRRHARIRFSNGQWFIQDMGSQIGTYVNGVRVNAAALKSGDRIRIGSTEFEFRK